MIQYLYNYVYLYFVILIIMVYVDIFLFQVNLIDVFSIWYNFLELVESKIKDEDKIIIWRTILIFERQWREYVRIVWDILFVLVVYLFVR